MKTLATSFILALALVAPGCGGGGSSRDDWSGGGGGGSGSGSGTCEMKTLVKADWCATCRTFCGAACPVDAKGNCKGCGNATTKRDACVKTYWSCNECKTNHDKVCNLNDSYQCCTKSESKSPLQCACGPACAGASCAKCKEKGGCKPRCLH